MERPVYDPVSKANNFPPKVVNLNSKNEQLSLFKDYFSERG
jgi:hypothetical protein